MQDEKLTIQWLASRGYSVRAAALAVGRVPSHLLRVLKTERHMNAELEIALRSLPARPAIRAKRVVTFA